jgi:hypothetical protein
MLKFLCCKNINLRNNHGNKIFALPFFPPQSLSTVKNFYQKVNILINKKSEWGKALNSVKIAAPDLSIGLIRTLLILGKVGNDSPKECQDGKALGGDSCSHHRLRHGRSFRHETEKAGS